MNIADILIIALIAIALFFAVRHVVKLRKSGGCACGSAGGCSGCTGSCASCPSCAGCIKASGRPTKK